MGLATAMGGASMTAPLIGALVLFGGWIASVVVMLRRSQRGRGELEAMSATDRRIDGSE
jgi:hypothetical protein